MAIEIGGAAGGGKEIGDIIQSSANALADGKKLLPLGTQRRLLTAAELAASPVLAGILPTLPAFSKPLNVGTTVSVGTKNSYTVAGLANGTDFYTDDGVNLKKYTYSSNSVTTAFAGATSDQIPSISCSADGQVVAFILWDSSATRNVLYISTDFGASFAIAENGSSGGSAGEKGTVYVNSAGTMVAAVVPDGSSNIRYYRVDDPVSSIVPDINLVITPNLPITTSVLGSCTASFSEDGTKFVVTYANSTATDELVSCYSEDSGASFTRITAYPLDRALPQAVQSDWQIMVDSNDFNKMVLVFGQASESYSIWASVDKGLTWFNIPSPDYAYISNSNDVVVQGGWQGAITQVFTVKNGYFIARTSQGFHYLVNLTNDGQAIIVDKIYDKRAAGQNVFGVTWATDNLSFGVNGTTGNNEYSTVGVMTIGKSLPGSSLFSNEKIVADAP